MSTLEIWWIVTITSIVIVAITEIKRRKFENNFYYQYLKRGGRYDSNYKEWWFHKGAAVCSILQILVILFLMAWLLIGSYWWVR